METGNEGREKIGMDRKASRASHIKRLERREPDHSGDSSGAQEGAVNDPTNRLGKRPFAKHCPRCGQMMVGPYEAGDESGDYFEWNCRNCGHVCQKFRWEYPRERPQETRQVSGPPWWKDEKRWAELMERIRSAQD